MRHLAFFAGALALACASSAFAQTSFPASAPRGDGVNVSTTPTAICWRVTATGAVQCLDDLHGLPGSGGGTGGGGGPTTIADGADGAEGSTAATAWDLSAPTASLIALNKAQALKLEAVRAAVVGLGTPAQAGGKIDTVIASASVDRGASITGPTAVTLAPANAVRRGFSAQNQSTGACWLNGVATAAADFHSLQIGAGAYFESSPHHVGTGAISAICPGATAAAPAPFYLREF